MKSLTKEELSTLVLRADLAKQRSATYVQIKPDLLVRIVDQLCCGELQIADAKGMAEHISATTIRGCCWEGDKPQLKHCKESAQNYLDSWYKKDKSK